LVGETYMLADIAMIPYINRIEVLDRPQMIQPGARPNITR
jgi:glutathione S-transferase